jgi:hypothetical protein
VDDLTATTSPDVLSVAAEVASELVAEGARAVVLAGSHARGKATDLSDIDLYAIGSGPAYGLRVVRGRLVAISWRTEEDEHRALSEPASVGEVVAAWRSARVIHDPDGVAAGLKREAAAFDWSSISAACDTWVAEATVGYAEEVLKLVAARHAGDHLLAAVQRSVLALRLPRVMAVHHRLMYETENRLWHLAAEAMGDEPCSERRRGLRGPEAVHAGRQRGAPASDAGPGRGSGTCARGERAAAQRSTSTIVR